MIKFLLGTLLLCVSLTCAAAPARVILFRHGETTPEGVFSLRGLERRAALVPFFTENVIYKPYGIPAAIYASKAEDSNINVTTEMVNPLAAAYGIKINANYRPAEFQQAAQEILSLPEYEGKLVLVCWTHDYLPQFAKALGIKDHLPRWRNDVYDQLWEVSLASENEKFTLLQQMLLYGDTPGR